ncbi:hypothetical protein [Frankia tisae]|uniref:hypothetical protein n=1 Tax=Frankia tisae TaxID=2950104 RepID=UPI0021BE92B9|nr:hypothetical protein [Frankia tisae]
MAPAPRFRRVAALQRRFVDREPVLAAFTEELTRIGEGPRVFNEFVVDSSILTDIVDTVAGLPVFGTVSSSSWPTPFISPTIALPANP